jgi:pyruvate dehydrogenase E1 component alpha subunit
VPQRRSSPSRPKFGAEEALGLLRTMWRIRLFEERVGQLKRADEVHGLIHLSVGQEGVAAGVCTQLRDDDAVYSGHRAHGHALAAGAPLERTMAELMGRADGLCKGLGGSMHLVDVERGFLGTSGIVAQGIPHATGAAWAAQIRKEGQVVLCFFGDGAVNEGAFHEALNVSALWNLPVVYIIENNRYGMGTAISRSTANEDVLVRAKGYRMEGESVDGQDVFAVRECMARASERARKEKRPTLIEMRTYRFMGHSMSDAVSGTYRTKDELEENMKRDPILVLHNKMYEMGELTEGEMHKIDDEAKAISQDAWDFADASPEPPLEKLYTDVYADTSS